MFLHLRESIFICDIVLSLSTHRLFIIKDINNKKITLECIEMISVTFIKRLRKY